MLFGDDSRFRGNGRFRRFDRATVRMHTMYALDAEIGERDQLSRARAIATEWIKRHALRMGAVASDLAGEHFELDRVFEHQLAAAVLATADDSCWAARLQHSQGDDVSRVWRTDIGIGESANRLALTVRVAYTGVLDENVSRRAPTFLRALVDQGIVLYDGDELVPEPWVPQNSDDIEQILELIVDEERTLPAIVLAAPPFTEPHSLAKKAFGVAHVIGVPAIMLDAFNRAVTLPWALAPGSVRTFFPNFDFAADSTVLAPAARAHTISNWIFEDMTGAPAFLEYLLNVCASSSVATRRSSPAITVSDIRATNLAFRAAVLADAARPDNDRGEIESIARLEEALAAANDEIEALKTSAEESRQDRESLQATVDELDGFLKDLEASETDTRKAMHSLSLQNRILVEALRVSGSPAIEAPILDAPNEVDAWATQYFSGRLVLTTRALRGIGESIYQDPRLIFEALALLGGDFQAWRADHNDGAGERFRAKLLTLGLEDSKCFKSNNPGRYKDQYTAHHAGRSFYLDRHLKKGIDPDPRIGFRLYYAWDEQNERVIVGWLTSHLDTRDS